MAYETITLGFEDKIARLTLNRPEALNAMNLPFWQEMVDAFNEIEDQSDARVVVIDGAGRHFTAGLDLSTFGSVADRDGELEEGRKRERLRRQILEMQETFSVFGRARMPVIAAVHGACIGGGVDLTSACDIRYCTEDAFYSIHETNIGMTADVGTLQRLPKLIPEGLVRELAFTGRRMAAAEALAAGYVNQVYADKEAMMAGVLEVAAEIARKSPLAVNGCKEMLNYARDHSVDDGLNYIATWNAAMLLTDDLPNAVAAQQEKREAVFSDLLPPKRTVRRRS